MAITIAKLQVYIGADVKEATSGLEQVGRGLKKISGDGKGIKDIFVGVLGANLLQNGVTAFKNLGLEAVNVYGDFEQLGLSLKALAAREIYASGTAKSMSQAMQMASGSAEDLLEWVKELAIKSPFDQAGVAKALQTAMAYGFTAKEAQRMTEAMIDFAAAGGGSTETMNRIALALGQIKAKGSLAGQEILQLTEARIDVNATLARAFGKTTQEIVQMRERGLIPAEDAINAIVDVIGKDFEGAAEAASGTLTGMVNTLGKIKEIGIREYFGPFFEELKPKLQEMITWLQDEKTVENIRAMGEGFADTAMQLIDGAGKVVDWWVTLDEKSQNLITTIATIGLLTPVISRTFGDIALAGAKIVNVLPNIVSGFKAWSSGMSLTTSLGAAGLSPIAISLGSIAVAVGAVTLAWMQWNEQITKTNRTGIENVGEAYDSMFSSMIDKGSDVTQVMDEYHASLGRIRNELENAGALQVFVDKQGIYKQALLSVNAALVKSAGSYDEYKKSLNEAAKAAGFLIDEEGNLARVRSKGAVTFQEVIENNVLLSESSFDAANGIIAQADAIEGTTGAYDEFQAQLHRLELAQAGAKDATEEQTQALLSAVDVYNSASSVLQEYDLNTATLAETLGLVKDPAEQLKEDIALLTKLYGEGFISLESYNRMMVEAAGGGLSLSEAARQVYTDLYNSNAEMERAQTAANEAKAGILGLAEAMKGMSEAQFVKQYMDQLLETIKESGDPTGVYTEQWKEMALQYGFASEASLEIAEKQGALNMLIESGIIPLTSLDEALRFFFTDAQDGQVDLLALMEQFGNLDGASKDLGGAFYDLQVSLDELTKKYDQNGDGVLSSWEKTEKYRKELLDLKSTLDAIMSKTVDLDVNVNVHGDTDILDGWWTNPVDKPFDGYEYKALGGPIYPGKGVVVGERGPEVIYPGFGGTVVPNSELTEKRGPSITIVNNYRDTVLDDYQMMRVLQRAEVMGLL